MRIYFYDFPDKRVTGVCVCAQSTTVIYLIFRQLDSIFTDVDFDCLLPKRWALACFFLVAVVIPFSAPIGEFALSALLGEEGTLPFIAPQWTQTRGCF